MPTQRDIVDAYVKAFVELTPENVEDLYNLVSDEVLFTDPFNQITSKTGFKRVFDHMFETCVSPKFIVSDVAHSDGTSYLRWRMTGKLKSWPHTKLNFEGMTEVHVNSEPKISKHIDHWDSASQLLQHLPVIGSIVRPILRMFRLKQEKI